MSGSRSNKSLEEKINVTGRLTSLYGQLFQCKSDFFSFTKTLEWQRCKFNNVTWNCPEMQEKHESLEKKCSELASAIDTTEEEVISALTKR